MTKHKVKYRVVGADRAKRKYSINLDDGTFFHLTQELLQGAPAQTTAQAESKPLCSYVVQNGALWIRAGANQSDIIQNGKPMRECEARPGDLVQVGEFSIEILECPHSARDETNSTQFLDVSEMFGTAAKAVAPEAVATQAPIAAASSLVSDEEFPQVPQESPTAVRSYTPAQESKPQDHSESHPEIKEETRVVEHHHRAASTPAQASAPASAAAARTRSTHEDSRGREEKSRSSSLSSSSADTHRPRSGSYRDMERPSMSRQSKRAEEAHKPRHQNEAAPASFTESDFSHLAISAGMAALGVAATTRVLVNGSATPQGMLVACAALSSIPVVLGISLGLTRLNEYLEADSHMRDYARFLGWALICTVPWAYTQGASFPIAIFTTLLTTVLVSVAFIARFRPHIARFSGVGAGLSAAALVALTTHHHFAAEKDIAQESSSHEAPVLADTSTPTAPTGSLAPTTQTAAAVGQTPPAASPQSLSPQGQSVGQPQAAALAQQNAAPAIPSAVNDTIPPIPGHVDTQNGANALGRTPANADPSAKGIIDPLAHEEFFSAIKMGNLEVVRSLIDRKQVDPDFTLDKGSTPLITAAASGRLKVVEYLLRRRVNINAQDPHGTTALMWAVFKGHRDVAKFLISKGADTKVIRDDGDTAMDIARKWRQNEIVALLKEASQDDGGPHKKTHSSRKKHRR